MKLKPNKLQLLGLLPDALVMSRGPRQGNALYLSFDDGPHPEHTPRLLDQLAAHGAHASFFLVGTQVEKYPQLAARIAAEGHLLGNHSWSHPSAFGKMTLQQQLHEIGRTDVLLAEFDQRSTHRFRPPRGSFSLSLLLHFAGRRRAIAYWSYDSLDYRQWPVADVAARLSRVACAGAGDPMRILYHHRTRGRHVEGVHIRGIVDALRELGHEVTVMSFPGADPEQEPTAAEGHRRSRLAGLVASLPGVFFEFMELAYNLVTLVRMSAAIRRWQPQAIYERYSLFLWATV